MLARCAERKLEPVPARSETISVLIPQLFNGSFERRIVATGERGVLQHDPL